MPSGGRFGGMPEDHPPGARESSVAAGAVVCVDVGSTFTKAAAIDASGAVVALSQHPTTSGSDVLEGLDLIYLAVVDQGIMIGDMLAIAPARR